MPTPCWFPNALHRARWFARKKYYQVWARAQGRIQEGEEVNRVINPLSIDFSCDKMFRKDFYTYPPPLSRTLLMHLFVWAFIINLFLIFIFINNLLLKGCRLKKWGKIRYKFIFLKASLTWKIKKGSLVKSRANDLILIPVERQKTPESGSAKKCNFVTTGQVGFLGSKLS